ncbi:D-glycero-beta-D-manno-heptose-7-phosphate kinase [Nitrogeniibacter mangrovi]|uniref:D-glycero-beta-D-manno-heptose-7-phosphate kinase n=1 Tax=Nitrogeniibacter mangrovi TaxID=2016596 RepID=A0A6C1B197_9RHOO|nr:D-glycero-beta-D-manno-heptose-7-phosphate kinase [Nitrogeniibacter mangrovi]QID17396.1 D-glycero-beta-D-manno-heptose-7-phosphate kinase [Nitrogeniibacter mangrovi]
MVPASLPDTSGARVLVVGDVMLDRYWFGDVSRISPEAPVPVVRMTRAEDRPGGAANVARNVAALGAQASLLSVVGEDEAADALTRLLDESSIDAHLFRDPALQTTLKLRVVGRSQQLLRIDFEQRPQADTLAAKLQTYAELVAQHDLVLLSDYDKGALDHVAQMIELARQAGKPVLVDPKGDDFARYKGASVLTPNRGELQGIVGRWRSEDDLRTRVDALRAELDLSALLLTRSEEGMTLFTDAGVFHEPARAREVFDVSGAGDTVIATFAVMLASGADAPAAMAWANLAAGIVVGKLGTAVATIAELRGAAA